MCISNVCTRRALYDFVVKIKVKLKWFNESKGFGFITPADGVKMAVILRCVNWWIKLAKAGLLVNILQNVSGCSRWRFVAKARDVISIVFLVFRPFPLKSSLLKNDSAGDR
ncbi:cold shock domain-containing protein [Salmonella enterica subsp. enterica serovar Weltevreden]|nr:cold shock domain-containing protein [Salmonella enterica subsp. enterica serovar Weltevreden]